MNKFLVTAIAAMLALSTTCADAAKPDFNSFSVSSAASAMQVFDLA
jgi:hypothetical protein